MLDVCEDYDQDSIINGGGAMETEEARVEPLPDVDMTCDASVSSTWAPLHSLTSRIGFTDLDLDNGLGSSGIDGVWRN